MHTLTPVQVLALLCAAPVDESATAAANGDVEMCAAGHVAPWEARSARHIFDRVRQDPTYPNGSMSRAREILARVFGLPAKAPDDVEPIVMSLAWESDAERVKDERLRLVRALMSVGDVDGRRLAEAVEARCADLARIRAALEYSGPSPLLPVGERVEQLVAEVKELRANVAALLRADVGPESGEPFVDPAELAQAEADRAADAALVPFKPLSFCAGPSCPGYPCAASTMAHPASCDVPVTHIGDDEVKP